MDPEALAKSRIGLIFIKLLAAAMESRFRYRFFGPDNILKGADIQPGQAVLELGCGTGYFTLPAARLIGEHGSLVAMDMLIGSVEMVSLKVQTANLQNVKVVKGDALDTHLDAESLDKVLLFGVIPAPTLPLKKLLPEMHRILKPEGKLAIWPSIPGWLAHAILHSGLFTYVNLQQGVHNFKRF